MALELLIHGLDLQELLLVVAAALDQLLALVVQGVVVLDLRLAQELLELQTQVVEAVVVDMRNLVVLLEELVALEL